MATKKNDKSKKPAPQAKDGAKFIELEPYINYGAHAAHARKKIQEWLEKRTTK